MGGLSIHQPAVDSRPRRWAIPTRRPVGTQRGRYSRVSTGASKATERKEPNEI